ncbi:hypothetical protein PSTG_13089 [Puccinia striiformis f. sp. tritici PST-78]|uniref:Retrotransposon gag domain-containing protein n=1 Tax=Puccinia striiformis f. sp. tritici PST-78 TaxID=1165861 RepID=A0A0L0V317_9BASI|nr:hypothetical protein PSTG_13089 [Puccinia striiformis f. sp. tritici PST-78]
MTPPQFRAVEPFLQWIHGVQIFFNTKAISHPDDKICVAGGLLKTTILPLFYANEGPKNIGNTWEAFKTQLFKVTLPRRRTDLKANIRQLKMTSSKSFIEFSTCACTL